jgi:hypothetical protein
MGQSIVLCRWLKHSEIWKFLLVATVAAAPAAITSNDEILNAPVSSFSRKNVSLADVAIGIANELSVRQDSKAYPRILRGM